MRTKLTRDNLFYELKKAAKRWLTQFRKHHKTVRGTVLLDNLYCRQPFLMAVREQRLNFIARSKPTENPTLYEWTSAARQGDNLETITIPANKGTLKYKWINGMPIRDTADALEVNFCTLLERDTQGKILRRFEFVMNIKITSSNVQEIVTGGRRRRRVENENNNTLKTKGYYFEHNYGHDQ